jgi:hypothetical protein
LLVRQRGNPEWPRGVEVDRVDHSIAKAEISGKNVAREGGKKKVEEDKPSRLMCNIRPGLDYRPPKKKSGYQEGRVLGDMPGFRS